MIDIRGRFNTLVQAILEDEDIDVVVEGQRYETKAGQPWLRTVLDNRATEKAGFGLKRWSGNYHVEVFYPAARGSEELDRICGLISGGLEQTIEDMGGGARLYIENSNQGQIITGQAWVMAPIDTGYIAFEA